MEDLFKVIVLNNKEKVGNLKTEAHSQVKSTKYFPVYMIDGKKMIFKPLSKTKPLTTPLFSYSEVYWSYIINKYFDKKAPRYYLAISKGMEEEQPKYYEQGVLVESLTKDDEKLINLFDYFNQHPDSSVDISNYINYCMKNYDYTEILLSDLIKNNKEIGKGLAYQILLSILRQDRNFHYENINFFDGTFIKLAPPIDFEFSIPFLYPEQPEKLQYEKDKYIDGISIKYEDDEMSIMLKQICLDVGFKTNGTLISNICTIVKLYPEVVSNFVKSLDKLIADLPQITIDDPNNYIGPLNSDYWEIGHAFYKENNIDKAEKLKSEIELKTINKDESFKRISSDILDFSKHYNLTLKTYLIGHCNGIEDLEDMTIKDLLKTLNIDSNFEIEDIDIDSKKIKLKNKKY